jgi:enoyl-CoA hydratase/carnithine racemase
VGGRAGLVPGGGAIARLSRLVGGVRALEVLLGADDMSGDLAHLYGLMSADFSHRVTLRPDSDTTWVS